MSSTPEEREAKSRSAAIDRQLRHDARDYENTVKILLLGEGWWSWESGRWMDIGFRTLSRVRD